MNRRGVRSGPAVPDKRNRTRLLIRNAIRRVPNEENVTVRFAALCVDNRQTARKGSVVQRVTIQRNRAMRDRDWLFSGSESARQNEKRGKREKESHFHVNAGLPPSRSRARDCESGNRGHFQKSRPWLASFRPVAA